MSEFVKYPRTSHIEGSGIQKGDKDRKVISFREIQGRHLIIEEKVDGANCGISFINGEPKLQSRGHTLTGGPRERQFSMFKDWGLTHRDILYDLLGERFIMFGEWMYAKHSEFYDQLPHYFMEFDVYDRVTEKFLSTPRRQSMFGGTPVVSVPILFSGKCDTLDDLTKWIGLSNYKSDQWREHLAQAAHEQALDPDRVLQQSDLTQLMEGLYVKHEDGDYIIERYKFVRPEFTQLVAGSDEHWMSRPVVPNRIDSLTM